MLMSLNLDLDLIGELLGKLGKPKVGYLGLSIVHEDVRDFQVSVDDVLLCQVLQALVNVFDYGDGLLLTEELVDPELAFQIPLIAQLGYNIAVSIARKHFKATQNIRMVQLLQHFNLREQQLLQLPGLERIELYDFYCHSLVLIII